MAQAVLFFCPYESVQKRRMLSDLESQRTISQKCVPLPKFNRKTMEKNEGKKLFTASEEMKEEYCAKIVRIGEMKEIEGSDFLVQTFVDGFSIVVSKGQFTVGEPVIYCMNETALNKDFLAANNQFELSLAEMNANADEVLKLKEEGNIDEAKKLVGFFNKHGRVKLIKLRGCPSYGCIFKKDSLVKWKKKLANENLEDYFTIDENGIEHPFSFDTIAGELFAEAYVPPIQFPKTKREIRREKGIKRFKRIIPGEFLLHYDTAQLQSSLWRFEPSTKVTISVKLHGTSVIVANVLTRIPVQITSAEQWFNRKVKKEIKQIGKSRVNPYWGKTKQEKRSKTLADKQIADFKIGYGPVFSSRTVIKNQFDSKYGGFTAGHYGQDIWTEYGNLIFKHLDKGMTLYGEICGYLTQSDSMIQGGYDYRCDHGKNFLMPYRITVKLENGTKEEWNVQKIHNWTVRLMNEHPEISDRLKPIPILYHGSIAELYPDIPNDASWGMNFLDHLANDVEHFGMEKNEPFCKNKVPREGICIRIDDDPVAECFKLKTFAFLKKEQLEMDAGNVNIEMRDAYATDSDNLN